MPRKYAVEADPTDVGELDDLTDEVPEELVAELGNDALKRFAIVGSMDPKKRVYYDRWNTRSEIDHRLLSQQLKKRDPKTGQKLFFLRPVPNPLVRLTVDCPHCGKTIYEPVADRPLQGNEVRRQRSLLYLHVNAKHYTMVPYLFDDEKELAVLMRYAGR